MWIETQKGRCSGTAGPWHLGVKHGTSRVPPPMALRIPSPWLWTGDTESPRVTAKPSYCRSLPMGVRGAVIFLQGCLSPDQTLWKNETFLDKMQFLSCEGPECLPNQVPSVLMFTSTLLPTQLWLPKLAQILWLPLIVVPWWSGMFCLSHKPANSICLPVCLFHIKVFSGCTS